MERIDQVDYVLNCVLLFEKYRVIECELYLYSEEHKDTSCHMAPE